jgi:hypothetical protein
MSDPVHPDVDQDSSSEVPASGPNLPLFYSLIVLALVAAITLALMIVVPFHHRH